MILFVDPGKRSIGYCTAENKRLVHAGLHSFENHFQLVNWLRGFGAFEKVVCEMPQSYTLTKQKGDQNDLLTLAVTVGAVASVAPAALPKPRTWKGGITKAVHHKRVLEELARRPEAQAIMTQLEDIPQSLRHNTLDAVALALWWLDRTDLGRVAP